MTYVNIVYVLYYIDISDETQFLSNSRFLYNIPRVGNFENLPHNSHSRLQCQSI